MPWRLPNPDNNPIPGNDPKFPKHPDGSRDLDKHWSHVQTYKQMEDLLKTGKVKAIGVANYSARYLRELLPHVSVVPAVNQIENHPYLPQQDIVDFCKEKGIHVTAYSPLGSSGSPLLHDERVTEVAEKHGVPASAILLSYLGTVSSYVLFFVRPVVSEVPLLTVCPSCSWELGTCEIRNAVTHRREPEAGQNRRQ